MDVDEWELNDEIIGMGQIVAFPANTDINYGSNLLSFMLVLIVDGLEPANNYES